MYRVVHRQPDTSRLPDQIRSMVERCLAKDPAQRPSAAELLAEVGAALPAAGWLPAPISEAVSRYPTDPAGTVVPARPVAPTADDNMAVTEGAGIPGQGAGIPGQGAGTGGRPMMTAARVGLGAAGGPDATGGDERRSADDWPDGCVAGG